MLSDAPSSVGVEQKPAKLFVSPLAWLTASAQWILTEKAYRHFVENRVVASYDQYFRSLSARQSWLCRWIIVRCVMLIAWDLLKEPLIFIKDSLFGPSSRKRV
jgi:hypothetical protein